MNYIGKVTTRTRPIGQKGKTEMKIMQEVCAHSDLCKTFAEAVRNPVIDYRQKTWSELRDTFETKRKQETFVLLKSETKGQFVVVSMMDRPYDDIESRAIVWDADTGLMICRLLALAAS